ncbi:MAG TPA: sigma-70 family RNA polymerase sigma factor [Candidatus Saccharimonadales bacterium]|nr:sigma-70 family RNA polymerase sigma factor [Candidatus Saccharimonadales bacterium]
MSSSKGQSAGKGFGGAAGPAGAVAIRAFQAGAGARAAGRRGGLGAAEERQLVAAARGGDAGALRRLLDGLSRPIYRFAQGFCRNAEDAEEVLQRVLTALARSLKDFRGEAALTTWAYTVARNACIRHRRSAARAPASMEPLDASGGDEGGGLQVADPGHGPHEQLEHRELREVLERAIGSLPEAQRQVLMLRDVEGLPAAEVGRALGLGERAVKSRLHRARLSLRRTLAPYLRGEGLPAAGRGRGPRRALAAGARSALPAASRVGAPAGRCPDTARMLSRYLEGELSPEVCARMESHVAGCPSCGQACATLIAALGACRRWGEGPLPPAARAQVRRAIRSVMAAELG